MTAPKNSNSVLLPLGPTFQTAYGPRNKIPLYFDEAEGRTKQEFKDECDIHHILKRYEATGSLEHINKREALYVDVTGHDYQLAMDIIADARSAFLDLPARVRDRFDNDPQKMLEFVEDQDNAEEAAELGLLSPEGIEALAQRAKASEASSAPPAPAPGPAPAPAPEVKPGSA